MLHTAALVVNLSHIVVEYTGARTATGGRLIHSQDVYDLVF